MTTIYVQPDSDGSHNVKVQSDNKWEFRTCLDMLKSFINAYYRSYDPAARHWIIGEPASESLQRWLSYCAAHFNARVEWLDITDDGPFKHERKRQQPKPDNPYAVLHLRKTAQPELVKAAYKTLAQLHHPDKGGDTKAMQAINEAYRQLAA